MNAGIKALALYGVQIPTDEAEQERVYLREYATLASLLDSFTNLDDLVNLPLCEDKTQARVMLL
jgi:hypothetical protein